MDYFQWRDCGIYSNYWKLTRKIAALETFAHTLEDEVKANTSQLLCASNLMQLSSGESSTQINSLTHFRWWEETTGRKKFLFFFHGVSRRKQLTVFRDNGAGCSTRWGPPHWAGMLGTTARDFQSTGLEHIHSTVAGRRPGTWELLPGCWRLVDQALDVGVVAVALHV